MSRPECGSLPTRLQVFDGVVSDIGLPDATEYDLMKQSEGDDETSARCTCRDLDDDDQSQ